MTTFKPGEVTRVNFTSDILNRDITLSIYLPKDYSALRQYKIIFCFDGRDFFSFGQIHRKYEKLRQTKKIDDAIFVGFHYETVDKRREEFHPQGARATYCKSNGARTVTLCRSTISNLSFSE